MSRPVEVSREVFEAVVAAGQAAKQRRAEAMPTEHEALKVMHDAWLRLKELGWREAIYCPKDGSWFDAVEPGSTGIHRTQYSGEWPKGGWWCQDGGDLWPSRPCLYRPTEAELAEQAERIARFRASHGRG